MAHALVSLFDPAQRSAGSSMLPFETTRTGRDGAFAIGTRNPGETLVLSVSTPAGYAEAPVTDRKTKTLLRLTHCDHPVRIEMIQRGTRATRLPSYQFPVRLFTSPPKQFVIETKAEKPRVCLPPGEYTAQAEHSNYRIGPSNVLAFPEAPTSKLEVWSGGGSVAAPPQLKRYLQPVDHPQFGRRIAAQWARYRVVALGENSHGSANGLKLLRRFFAEGAVPLDFRILAVETDAYAARAVDAALARGDEKALELALSKLPDWVFATEEFTALLRELAQENRRRGAAERIQVVGLDVVLHYFAYADLMAALKKQQAALYEKYRKPLDLFSLSGMQLEEQLDAPKARELGAVLMDLGKELEVAALATPALAPALEDLRYLREYLRWSYADDPLGARDAVMAAGLLRALDVRPAAKAIVLAHNGHITFGANDGSPSLGEVVKKALGSSYMAIGTLYGGGVVRAVHHSEGLRVQRIGDMANSPVPTLERALHALAASDSYWPLDALPRNSPIAAWLNRGQLHQNIGAMYNPEEGALHRMAVLESFDTLLYFPTAQPTTALRRTP
ncbi:MAG: erythromycin esterase family protein [Betaproteobacteria bacterium]|nr:erythromycin esterase family protein [Betaproteobacteria bacterium]